MSYAKGCIFAQHGNVYVRFRKDPAIRLGTTKQLPTKEARIRAARPYQDAANASKPVQTRTVGDAIDKYRKEVMSKRASTAACENSWINNHIEPQWGETSLAKFGRPPEAILSWLKGLDLSTKSKREIKGICRRILDASEVWGWIETAPDLGKARLNREKGEDVEKARVLPLPEFRQMLGGLSEPFKTMACVAYFNGLRVSELFGLRWTDIDWLHKQVCIKISVVNQIVDVTKTPASEAVLPLSDSEIEMLQAWRQTTEFKDNWVFASPFQAGEKPYSYTGFKQILWAACDKAGIARITPHSFRHSLRAWLKAQGASAELTTSLMRHSKYDMSRQYGAHDGAVSPAVREIHKSLVEEALG